MNNTQKTLTALGFLVLVIYGIFVTGDDFNKTTDRNFWHQQTENFINEDCKYQVQCYVQSLDLKKDSIELQNAYSQAMYWNDQTKYWRAESFREQQIIRNAK